MDWLSQSCKMEGPQEVHFTSLTLDNIFKHCNTQTVKDASSVSLHWNDAASRLISKRCWVTLDSQEKISNLSQSQTTLPRIRNLSIIFKETNSHQILQYLATIGNELWKLELKNCVSTESFNFLFKVLTQYCPQLRSLEVHLYSEEYIDACEFSEMSQFPTYEVINIDKPLPTFSHKSNLLKNLKQAKLIAQEFNPVTFNPYPALPQPIITFFTSLIQSSPILEELYDYSNQIIITPGMQPCSRIRKYEVDYTNSVPLNAQSVSLSLKLMGNSLETLIFDGNLTSNSQTLTIIQFDILPNLKTFENRALRSFWLGSIRFLNNCKNLEKLVLSGANPPKTNGAFMDALFETGDGSFTNWKHNLKELQVNDGIKLLGTTESIVAYFPKLERLTLTLQISDRPKEEWISKTFEAVSKLKYLRELSIRFLFDYDPWYLLTSLFEHLKKFRALETLSLTNLLIQTPRSLHLVRWSRCIRRLLHEFSHHPNIQLHLMNFNVASYVKSIAEKQGGIKFTYDICTADGLDVSTSPIVPVLHFN